ncbi:MAG: hypothetical protein J6T63_04580 [Bacteroidales bacterium]|nr:hypothetical protein [Bacteroidales bacterium]
MKKFLTIMLCMALVAMAGNVFGQIKPSKKPRQVSTNYQVKPSANNVVVDNKEACWEITGANGYKEYRWDKKANVQQWIQERRNQYNEIYEYAVCEHQTVEVCDASNEKINPKKCWKITGTKSGQTVEQYLWATETVARRKAMSLRNDGYQNAKYEQTPLNDEKSCVAPANNSNDPACWKITIDNAVSYYWGFEQDAQATVNAARNAGQTASYELSPNKTKDTCK